LLTSSTTYADDPPAETAPEPVETAPEPVETAPEPVETAPEPVETAPESVETAPEPVETAPESVETAPSETVQDETAPEDELPPLIKEPALIQFVEAPYPAEAESERIEGSVGLLIEIDETGAVSHVEVDTPAGHGFDEAALEAAKQFVFSPAEDEYGPVPVLIEFAYGFALDAAPEEPEAPPVELPINLDGTLTEKGTRQPLAAFEVTLPDLEMSAESDANGKFFFRGVPVGTHRVKVARPGFDLIERTIEITEGEAVSLALWLRNQSYREDALVGTYERAREEITRRTLTVEEVRRVPGSFGDPVRVIQSLPGAARSPFGTGFLIIRGANPEDSGVYVDGIRIPLIYHLGGYVSVLNADLIEAVDYLPGGFGVQYGRSTGGVIDVRTKREYPEHTIINWSTDILDSGGLVQGRTGKNDNIGFAFAGRRSYIDAILPLFYRDSGFIAKPRWFDYQAKLAALGTNDTLELFVFGFQDLLLLGTPDDVSQGTQRTTQGDVKNLYGTHRIMFTWEHAFNEQFSFRAIPSLGQDVALFELGADWLLETTQWMLETRAELDWTPNDAVTVTAGADYIGVQTDFRLEFPINPDSLVDYDPLSELEPWAISDTVLGHTPAFYLDTKWRPLPNKDRLLIRPGIRLNSYSIVDGASSQSWDPRLAFRYGLLENSAIKASAGVYQQPPQPFEIYDAGGHALNLDYERAKSVTVGFEQRFTPLLHADIEFFHKDLDQLIVQNQSFAGFDDDLYSNDGIGRVRGMELMVKHDPGGRFFGWVSYTLSESERNDQPDDPDSEWYPFEFDQPHILIAVAGWTLPYDLEFSGRFQYVSGNPFTPYENGVYDIDTDSYTPYQTADYNSYRMPAYQALDLRVEKLFTFNQWQLSVYCDFLNAYKGENPEGVQYNYDYTEWEYVGGLPFIPNPGFDAEFHF